MYLEDVKLFISPRFIQEQLKVIIIFPGKKFVPTS